MFDQCGWLFFGPSSLGLNHPSASFMAQLIRDCSPFTLFITFLRRCCHPKSVVRDS